VTIQTKPQCEVIVFVHLVGVDVLDLPRVAGKFDEPQVARNHLALVLEGHQVCLSLLADLKPQLRGLYDRCEDAERLAPLKTGVHAKGRQGDAEHSVGVEVLGERAGDLPFAPLQESGEVELLPYAARCFAPVFFGAAELGVESFVNNVCFLQKRKIGNTSPTGECLPVGNCVNLRAYASSSSSTLVAQNGISISSSSPKTW